MRDDGIPAQNERYEIEVVVTGPSARGEKSRKRSQLELYRAAVKGDWGIAEDILKNDGNDIADKISKVGDTVLHIAAAASRTLFVKQLVEKYYMTPNDHLDLTTKNDKKYTAFSLAVASGNMELVEFLMDKKRELAQIPSGINLLLPVQLAAEFGHEKILLLLYETTKKQLKDGHLMQLLVTAIDNSLYDVALLLQKEHPKLATLRDGNNETALHALARKPLMIPHQQRKLKNFFNLGTNMIDKKKMHPKALELAELLWETMILLDDTSLSLLIGAPFRLIFHAAEQGNDELLSKLIHAYPDLIFKANDHGHTIFHIAILYRHERIFNLIYETGSIKDLIPVLKDKEKNNILHLAARLPPPNRLNIVAGAALQMQRESLWFKEVNKLMPPFYVGGKNKKGKTASTLFTQTHRTLMKEGESWMKKTAESCMLVATLIATVVFAAAFTVPGSVKQDTGAPNFIRKASFTIFAISDTISLVTSSCSILTFLSILTSRYAEDDFLWSLPLKLLLGLFILFISIVAMMAVFCTTLFIVFNEETIVPAVFAVAFAPFPLIMIVIQQKRLILDVVQLISVSNSLFHKTQKGKQLKKQKQL
ncbi:hypothetical protein Dsin_028465 [Dipteronia sinensis]|uniref:PGG domain-containing protein n=1 Tax=Dipteronia sinensis TaxID=43782 RepID=A0AAE0DUM0_9ROSI|nr:hypothetical protein Dsin_028465 [Dipteronia sinensis]